MAKGKEKEAAKRQAEIVEKEISHAFYKLAIQERDAAWKEAEFLKRIIRDLCIGHSDDCACVGCRTVFRRDK